MQPKLIYMNYWSKYHVLKLKGVAGKTALAKHKILHFIHSEGEATSQSLKRRLNLSFPTANRYLNELFEEDYLECDKGDSQNGGPRPAVFSIKKDRHFCVGVDIGKTFLNIGIFDTSFTTKKEIALPPVDLVKREDGINALVEQVNAFISDTLGAKSEALIGVGICFPDVVNSESGQACNYWQDEQKSITEALKERLGHKVFIENDTNVRMLAESKFGVLKGVAHACYLQIDWGLGLGIVTNGRLYTGSTGYAGEIGSFLSGHSHDELCGTAIERIASGEFLVRSVQRAIEERPNSPLAKHFDGAAPAEITPRKVVMALQEGKQEALLALNRMADNLGREIAYLIHLLNPEVIVLGGAVSQAGEYLLVPVQQALLNNCLPMLRQETKIKLSALKSEAGIVGSALMIIDRMFNH